MFVVHMGIDLCRRDRSMTEECLDCSDICTFLDECCGEAVSQGMWAYFLGNACKFCIFSYNFFDAVSAEMLSKSVSRYTYEEIGACIMSHGEIGM